jgi:leader peptidase (prepilin peptidase)/N-methyltransferase
MTACLFLVLWFLDTSREWGIHIVFVSLLIVMSYIDFDTMEIPDGLSLGGMIVGFIVACFYLQPLTPITSKAMCHVVSLGTSFQGAMMGSALLLWIAIFGEKLCGREALGFGDIKLMGCIGAFLGTRGAVFSIFGGSFLGMLILMPYILYSYFRYGKSWTLVTKIPFGPFLSLGAVAYLLGADHVMDFYMRRCSFLNFKRMVL